MPVLKADDRVGSIRFDPETNYYWQVEEAEDTYSKNGDEQIKLILKVGNKSGAARISERLTFSESAYFRVEHFLKSAGKYPGKGVEIYFECGDVQGLTGWCTIKYEHNEQKNRDYARIDQWIAADRQVPDQTWIKRAQLSAQQEPQYATASEESIDPGDVPF